MVTLGIFARPPIAGQVKTRLIPDIGPDAAAAVYRHCLRQALVTARHSGLSFHFYLTEESDDALFRGRQFRLQSGEDLGARMLNALQQQLQVSPGGAIIIGSDCLDLNAGHLRDAAQSLENHDLVLSPAFDGGFALIGCSRRLPGIFDNVTWSSPHVLAGTLKNAENRGYRIRLLETVRDIDTLQDLQHYPELLDLIP